MEEHLLYLVFTSLHPPHTTPAHIYTVSTSSHRPPQLLHTLIQSLLPNTAIPNCCTHLYSLYFLTPPYPTAAHIYSLCFLTPPSQTSAHIYSLYFLTPPSPTAAHIYTVSTSLHRLPQLLHTFIVSTFLHRPPKLLHTLIVSTSLHRPPKLLHTFIQSLLHCTSSIPCTHKVSTSLYQFLFHPLHQLHPSTHMVTTSLLPYTSSIPYSGLHHGLQSYSPHCRTPSPSPTPWPTVIWSPLPYSSYPSVRACTGIESQTSLSRIAYAVEPTMQTFIGFTSGSVLLSQATRP